jgi:phospholipase/carboxylesterase
VTGPDGGAQPARLPFRPRPSSGSAEPREEPLGLGEGRDGVLYVPDTAAASAPLLVMLHGSRGSGHRVLRSVLAAADRYGVVVLAPDSRGPTWDVLHGGYGPDVRFVARALEAALARCDVDPSGYALGGISDGASYALGLGLSNGDVFGAVLAFSPGFAAAGTLVGRPRIFVSHGTADNVLPIDACSRRIVPALERAGYQVTYEEFDGGHTLPPPVADRAFAWWTAGLRAHPADM